MTDCPSDRAYAQAFREWCETSGAWRAHKLADTWIDKRAREIDAAAPDGAQETPNQRIAAMARVLQDAWAKAEPNHGVTRWPTSYLATFNDMARAAIAYTGRPPSQDAEDAARYRWLRDSSDGLPISAAAARDPAAFDLAIDAARAARGGG